MPNLIPAETIATKILIVRGKRVMLDSDLAVLYEVKTKRLNEQVARNRKRFPEDFMFQLTEEEADFLRSQNATSKRGGRRYLPYVFTQEGVAMLSSVLNSERAIMVNIQIMRAFAQLQRMLLTNRDLKRKIEEMEKKYDKQFAIVFQAIKQLLEPSPVKEKKIIGFRVLTPFLKTKTVPMSMIMPIFQKYVSSLPIKHNGMVRRLLQENGHFLRIFRKRCSYLNIWRSIIKIYELTAGII